MPGNSLNSTTMWTPSGGYGNYAAPATKPQLPPNPYQSGVTSGYLDASGNQQYAPTNPMQFATPQAAQGLATMLGGKAYGDQLTGPGMGWSTPQQLINIPGMQGSINAGLAANTLGMYGSAPGSYGQFELARDIAQNSGQQFNDNYNAWATSQPGWKPDPNLANSGPGFNMTPDGKGGFFNSAGMDASQMGAAYTQPNTAPPSTTQPPPPGMWNYNGQLLPQGQSTPTPNSGQPPATTNTPTPVGMKMQDPTGKQLTWNGTSWVPDAPATTPPVSPLAPGQTDPTGDARRNQSYIDAGYTQNAQGGWDPPPPPTTNSEQPPVYPGTHTPSRPIVGGGGPYQTDSRTRSHGQPAAQVDTSPYPSNGLSGYSPYTGGQSGYAVGEGGYGGSTGTAAGTPGASSGYGGYGGYGTTQPYQGGQTSNGPAQYGQGTSATTYGSSQYGNSSPYGYGSSYGNSGGNYGGNYGSQSNYGGYGGQSNYRDQAQSGQSSYGGGYNGQQLGQGSYGGYGDPRRSSQKAFGGGASSGGGNSTF